MRRNLVLLLVTLAALEVAARFVLGGAEQAWLYQAYGLGNGRCIGLRPGASVEYTGWLLRIPPVRLEVNALGYRGPERPPLKPAGTFRIAAVGDSYTYGLGVVADQTMPARLEDELNDGTSRRVEVLNFGIPGAQLDDTIAQVRSFSARWQPDLVLATLYADDLNGDLCRWARFPRLLIGLLSWGSYLFRAAHIGFNFAREWVLSLRGADPARAARLREGLRTLDDASRQAGARLAVVMLADPVSISRDADEVALMEQLGIAWLDARAWRYGDGPERLTLIPGELHFDAAGNRFAAQRIAAWLRDARLVTP